MISVDCVRAIYLTYLSFGNLCLLPNAEGLFLQRYCQGLSEIGIIIYFAAYI